MIRHRQGNAAKDTMRCSWCGFENLRPRDPPGEHTIDFTCRRCGMQILTSFGRRWMAEHPEALTDFTDRMRRRSQKGGMPGCQ